MLTLQSLFVVLVILLLCYLVVDGLLTRSVWVKGSRRGLSVFGNGDISATATTIHAPTGSR